MIEPIITVKKNDEKGMDALKKALHSTFNSDEEPQNMGDKLSKEFYLRFSEPAKELLKKLRYVGQVVENKPAVTILENVLFEDGYIIASDLTITIGVKTDIKGKFLVPCKQLIKIISLLDKNENVSFYHDNDANIVEVYINEVLTYKLASDDVDSFIKIPECVESFGRLTNQDIRTIVDFVKFASSDELRPAMTGIHVSESICATDGHCLAWRKMEGTMPKTPNNLAVIIPTKAAKAISVFNEAECFANFPNYSLIDGDKFVLFRTIDERFPQYENVIPDTTEWTVSFSIKKAHLVKTLKQALLAANPATKQIVIDVSNHEKIEFSSENVDFAEEFRKTISVPVARREVEKEFEINGKKSITALCPFAKIGINGKIVLDILSKCDENEIVFKMFAPNKAIIINEHMLVMPIMLSH